MLLELVNFRCFKNLCLEFPDNGIVLLNGTSGIGKTSILKAIDFVLFGKETKVITYNENKCSVTLTFKDLKIIRTKNPNFLKIILNGETYTDEAAQEIIYKKYGEKFNITSYIAQKSIDSFVKLSKNEKSDLVNKLAIKDVNISEIKDKVKNKIKERKEQIKIKSNEIRVLKNEITMFQDIDNYKKFIINIFGDNMDSESIKIKIELDKKKYKKILDKINDCTFQINNNKLLIKDYNVFIQKYEMLNKNKEKLITDLDKEKIHYNSLDNSFDNKTRSINYTICESFINLIEKRKEYYNLKDEISNCEKDLILGFEEEIKNSKSLLNKIPKEIENLFLQYSQIKKNIKKYNKYTTILNKFIKIDDDIIKNLDIIIINKQKQKQEQEKLLKEEEINNTLNKNEINNYKKCNKLECPSCNSNLMMLDDCVKIFNKKQMDDKIFNIESQLVKSQQQIVMLNNNLNLLNEEINSLEIIKSDIENEVNLFLIFYKTNNIENEFETIDTMYNDFRKLNEKISNNQNNKLEIANNKQIKNLKTKLKTIKENLDSLKIKKYNLCIEENLESFLKFIPYEIFDYSDIKNWTDFDEYDQDEILDIMKEYLKYLLEQKGTLEQIEKEIKNSKNRINKLEEELNNINNDLSKLNNEDHDFDENYVEIKESINLKLSQDMEDYIKIQKKLEECLSNYEKYNNYKKEIERYEQMNKKIIRCEKEEKAMIISLNTSEKLLKLITDSESLSLSNTLENINLTIKYYLEYFFPEGNLQIQLTPFKESKNDKKSEIDIEVYQNGEKITLDNLSGGEYDRVLLIIFLAFNNLVSGDLVLLDECLSSLNSELVEEIVEILKDTLKDKLVLITLHQANTGLFDKVIDVEKLRYI